MHLVSQNASCAFCQVLMGLSTSRCVHAVLKSVGFKCSRARDNLEVLCHMNKYSIHVVLFVEILQKLLQIKNSFRMRSTSGNENISHS